MNAPLDLAAWTVFFSGLALQVAAVIAASAILCLFVRSTQWRRIFWQMCLVSLLLLGASEITGLGRGLADWTAGLLRATPDAGITHASAAWGDATVSAQIRDEASPLPLQSAATSRAGGRSLLWPALVWGVGCAAVLFRLFLTQWFCGRMRRRSQPAPEATAREAIQVAHLVGADTRIQLLESDHVQSPVAFGWMKPTIILPGRFSEEFGPAERQAILAHEIAHLANRDPFWHLVAEIVLALHWWNPFVWWARRQFRMASEQCADVASAVLSEGPEALATSLVRLGAKLQGRQPFAGFGVEGSGFRSNLGRRVERLLADEPIVWRKATCRKYLVASCTGSAALVALATGAGFLIQAEAASAAPLTFGDSVRSAWKSSPSALALSAAANRDNGSTPRAASVSLEQLRSTQPTSTGEQGAAAVSQVRVESRFLEAPASQELLDRLMRAGQDWNLRPAKEAIENLPNLPSGTKNTATHLLVGTVATADLQQLLRDLQRIPSGADLLSAPALTVLSGHQAQISVAQNDLYGVTLDVTPFAEADAGFIALTLRGSVTEALAPDQIQVRQAELDLFTAPTGRTVVIGVFTESPDRRASLTSAKDLFIFATPKKVDPAEAPPPGTLFPAPLIVLPPETAPE